MSENYPSDVKLNENPDGTVSFATEVVATIAGLAANEVDGVASMSAPSSGFADMFSRKEKRNYTKGVRIDLDGNKVTVDVSIVVDYGSPVPDVARNIQENIKKAIETMSGLDVHSVDVHVTGISFEREQRANAELDEQQRKMLEKTKESEVPATDEKPEEPAAPEEDVEEEDDFEDDDFEDEALDEENDADDASKEEETIIITPVIDTPKAEEAPQDAEDTDDKEEAEEPKADVE